MPADLPVTSPLYAFTSHHRESILYNTRITALSRGLRRSIPLELISIRSSTPQTAADAVFDNPALLIIIDAFIPPPDLPFITITPVRRSPRIELLRGPSPEFRTRVHRGNYYTFPLYEASTTRPIGWDVLPSDYYPGYYNSDYSTDSDDTDY